jgi:hypothetical protein
MGRVVSNKPRPKLDDVLRRSILTLAVGWIFVRGCGIEDAHDSKASWGQYHAPLDFMAVHASRPSYIKVCGKTYSGVRGFSPYYLDVPTLNSVLFVTESMGLVRFHLVILELGQI